MRFMKAAAIAGIFIMTAGFRPDTAESAQASVGKIDMRRVYEEYHGIKEFKAEMQKKQQELQQAQEAGDEPKFMALYQGMQARQEEFQRDFESNLIKSAESVAVEANLDMVVIEVLYHTDEGKIKDVSGELIAEMNKDAS